MAPIDTFPSPVQERPADIKNRVTEYLRERAETVKAKTIGGISDEIRKTTEQEMRSDTKKSAPDPWQEEIDAQLKTFEDATKEMGGEHITIEETEAGVKGYTYKEGEENDIVLSDGHVKEMIGGSSTKAQDVRLTLEHERQHLGQRADGGAQGTLYFEGARGITQFQRDEGDAETGSQARVNGSEESCRGDIPQDYAEAQEGFLALKRRVQGDAEGQRLVEGLMYTDAEKADLPEVQLYFWNKGLESGTMDIPTVRKQAQENGCAVQAEMAIRHAQLSWLATPHGN